MSPNIHPIHDELPLRGGRPNRSTPAASGRLVRLSIILMDPPPSRPAAGLSIQQEHPSAGVPAAGGIGFRVGVPVVDTRQRGHP